MTDTIYRAQHLVSVAEGYIAADCLIRAAERLEKAAALFRQAHEEQQVDPANLYVVPSQSVLRERA